MSERSPTLTRRITKRLAGAAAGALMLTGCTTGPEERPSPSFQPPPPIIETSTNCRPSINIIAVTLGVYPEKTVLLDKNNPLFQSTWDAKQREAESSMLNIAEAPEDSKIEVSAVVKDGSLTDQQAADEARRLTEIAAGNDGQFKDSALFEFVSVPQENTGLPSDPPQDARLFLAPAEKPPRDCPDVV